MALRNGAQRTKELLRYLETDDLARLSFTKESSVLNDALLPHLQLLAISCHADHVFVSVFDRSRLYIIAETTAEPSNTKHRFGCEGNSLEGRLCTYTLELESTSKEIQPIFQISDLQYDERFKNMPFIGDPTGPRYRFYAGTPIVSNQGVNMGTVAFFATQPRACLSITEQQYLQDATKRIKDYFELRREATAGARLGALTSNFTNFVHDISLNTTSSADVSTNGSTAPKQHPLVPNGGSEARKSGYSVTDTTRIFSRAVFSIENALQLGSRGGILFLKANSNFVTSTITEPKSPLDKANRRIIACSDSVQDRLVGSSSIDLESLATEDLRDLVESSPRGRLWQYDSHGILSNDALNKQTLAIQHAIQSEMAWPNLLRKMFLDVRQIAFVPLLNAATGEWQDVCFVWSTYSTRMFNEIDLVMIFNYGQAVMTERAIQDALKSSLQKSDFLGSMSHELRTPLHGILTSLELLQHDHNLSTYQSTMLETIEKCGTALLDTINHILEFSKINTVQIAAEKQSSGNSTQFSNGLTQREADAVQFNLASLLEEVADMVRFADPKTSDTKSVLSEPCIVLDISKENWLLWFHKGVITRVLMNIIGNAFKFTLSGSVRVELSLERDGMIDCGKAEPTNQHILLKVTDTGIGMSSEFLESRAFVPFAQEDPLKPGIGLGLSICKKIITDINGNIYLQSEKGLGTVVTIKIPLPKDAMAPVQGLSFEDDKTAHNLASLLDSLKAEAPSGALRFAYIPSKDAQSPSAYNGLEASICRYLTQWVGFEQISITNPQGPDLLVLEEDHFSELKDGQCIELLFKSSNLILISTSPENRLQLQHRMERLRVPNFRILCVPCGPYKLISCVSSLLSIHVPNVVAHEPSGEEQLLLLPYADGLSYNRDVGDHITDPLPLSHMLDGLNLREPKLADSQESRMPISISGIDIKANEHASPSTDQPSIPETLPNQSDGPKTATQKKPAQKHRLLLVDDNVINLRLLQSFCLKKNYGEIELAADGQIAVDLVLKAPLDDPFDIILMDISMPVMNGFDATRAIREYEKKMLLKHATIIALTGLANERDQVRGFESGMDMYLTKPVKFKELDGILKERLCLEP